MLRRGIHHEITGDSSQQSSGTLANSQVHRPLDLPDEWWHSPNFPRCPSRQHPVRSQAAIRSAWPSRESTAVGSPLTKNGRVGVMSHCLPRELGTQPNPVYRATHSTAAPGSHQGGSCNPTFV
jgi:hypothetical protein